MEPVATDRTQPAGFDVANVVKQWLCNNTATMLNRRAPGSYTYHTHYQTWPEMMFAVDEKNIWNAESMYMIWKYEHADLLWQEGLLFIAANQVEFINIPP